MSSDSLSDIADDLMILARCAIRTVVSGRDARWMELHYENVGDLIRAEVAIKYLQRHAMAHREARADSAVPSSHVSETDEPKESRESILREALARLVKARIALYGVSTREGSAQAVDEMQAAWEAARSALAGIPK